MRVCPVINQENVDKLTRDWEYLKSLLEKNKIDYVEFRVDYLEIKDIRNVLKLISKESEKYTQKIIFTLRSKEADGEFIPDQKLQTELIQEADKLKLGFLDIAREDKFLLKVKWNNQIIYSYHNFKQTPEFNELKYILENMKSEAKEAKIYKLATFVNQKSDILSLKKLLESEPKDNLILIGMGQKAMQTRLDFPKIGSYLTFLSMEKSSAPGQISLDKYLNL